MTDTAAAPSTADAAFFDLEHELASTRRLLERVPDEHWDWTPHEKSMALGQLAAHVAQLPRFGEMMLMRDGVDAVKDIPRTTPPANNQELLQRFDEAAQALRAAVAGTTEEGWKQTWTLSAGGQVWREFPRAVALRTMAISHIIHHRAQLSVYLRLLDVPVPGLYGPSADER